MASDYTDGLAMKAVKLVFDNLPSAYENGANDPKAREEMHNASCMAGMAFANAFLGVNHLHGSQAWCVPSSAARCCKRPDPDRSHEIHMQQKFRQRWEHSHSTSIRMHCRDTQSSDASPDAQEIQTRKYSRTSSQDWKNSKRRSASRRRSKDYGIDEKYFLDTLDDMCEQAFNDQCTGANPRYPLIKEIKEIYLKCY